MNHSRLQSHRTFALLVSGAMLTALLCGCARNKNKDKYGEQTLGRNGDASFAAGAGRAPTATTSYSFAKILIAQGKDTDALYVLNRILREHPRFIPAHNEIAGIYLRSDRMTDAMATLKAGLKHSPNDPILLNNLGMCHLLQDDHGQALHRFTQATEAQPGNPTYRANRATALALLGRVKEAEADFRTVLSSSATRENLRILAATRKQQLDAARGEEAEVESEIAFVPTAPIVALAPTTAPAVVKAPTTAPAIVKAPTTAPTVAKAPTTAPVIVNAPTTAPAIVKAPATAPSIVKAPTTAPSVAQAPATAPALVKAPTTAPAIAKAPTTAPIALGAPTTAPTVAKAAMTAPSAGSVALLPEPSPAPAPAPAALIAKAPTTAPALYNPEPATRPGVSGLYGVYKHQRSVRTSKSR